MSTATSAVDRLLDGFTNALVERAVLTVTVAQAVKLTGYSERSLRKFVAQGRIKSTKIGPKRLLDYNDLKKFVRLEE